ncbi:MAG: DUF2336 domain-containing protein [Rhodobacteraceae bacterium]|nr:DUF2336 domain-containing protein [Paracoccaceae bacterium]
MLKHTPLFIERLNADSFARARTKLSPSERKKFAAECAKLVGPQTSPAIKEEVIKILTLVAQDVDARVREALSKAVAVNPNIPRDLARRLAEDIDRIAIPILELSEALTEDDILEIIEKSKSHVKLFALAGRRKISERVSEKLVSSDDHEVVVRLVENPGAAFDEKTLSIIVDSHGTDPRIQEGLVVRSVLPAGIAAKLINVVSDALLQQLCRLHPIAPDLTVDLLLETRERATIGLSNGLSDLAMKTMVEELQKDRYLTCSLVVRSACFGNLDFFCHALASLNHLEAAYIRQCVLQNADKELPRFWPREWSKDGLNCALEAVRIMLRMKDEAGKWPVAEYARRLFQRLLTGCETIERSLADTDIDQLIFRATRAVTGAESAIDPWANQGG